MRRIFFVYLLLLFAISLSATTTSDPQVLRETFKGLVDEAHAEPNDSFLISSLALFAADMRKAHIPNCLSCSLYLLKNSKDDSLDRQLIASRYAIIISPDLPDGYFARLYNFILYKPLAISKHFANLQEALSVFTNSSVSLSMYEYLTRVLLSISLISLFTFLMIVLIKYRKPLFHILQHVTGFSLFYLTVLGVLFITVAYHVIHSNGVVLFILLPLIALGLTIASKKEQALLLLFSFITAFLFVSHSVLEQYYSNTYNPHIAQTIINLYDPLFQEKASPTGDESHDLYLRGMHFFYKGSTSQALYYLRRALKGIQYKTISVSIHNTIGILEFEQKNVEKAVEAMREAWNTSHNNEIGRNLVRLLFEADQAKEAANLEQQIQLRDTFLFPKVYLPAPKKMLLQLSGKDHRHLFFYKQSIMFAISLILLMLVLFFLKRTFARHIVVSTCEECDSLICSECSPGGGGTEVCAVCQTIKQHREVVAVKDLKKHLATQEAFAKKRTIIGLIAMIALPGSGLILKDHIFEGTFYLTGIIVLVLLGLHLNRSVMLFSSTFSNSSSHIIFFGFAFAIFILSLIRTIRALTE